MATMLVYLLTDAPIDKTSMQTILKRVIDKADIDSKVFLLSATPMFDNPSEIALTLNLLRPKNTFPIGEDFFYTY